MSFEKILGEINCNKYTNINEIFELSFSGRPTLPFLSQVTGGNID